jgi:hypothetical protein
MVVGAPHGAAQDDGVVADVEDVDKLFVVFIVSDVDAK